MIQTINKQDLITEGIEDTVKMGLSLTAANQAHIVKVLTENYLYPIASTIRESASNAWDSHVMSNKKDTPFHVKFYKNSISDYTLEIEDFGLGLTKEEFYKYYMKVGNSSKQGVAGVLGFFGCGAKAALSIENLTNYEVICRKGGVETKFIVFKGGTVPESLLVHELNCTEEDGVLIKIPISRRDYNTTVTAIKEQLCYFKTAYIQIEDDGTDYSTKKIFENELFSWSEMFPSQEMHINFGGVHYPINWDILKINKLKIPIGIKIAPDQGINPFFNRESLEYSTLCKETILQRIKEVSEWFINKYNEEKKEFKSPREIYEYFNSSYKYLVLNDNSFKIDELEKHSSVSICTPTYKNIVKLPLRSIYTKWDILLKNYQIISEVSYNRFTTKVGKTSPINKLSSSLYLVDQHPKKIQIDFLKSQHSICYFVKKQKEHYLRSIGWSDINSLEDILSLKNHPKEDWRQLIKDWLFIEEELLKSIIPIPDIPKSWVDSNKKKKTLLGGRYTKAEGEVNFKFTQELEKYSNDWNCKFVPQIVNLKNFNKNKYLTVYELESKRTALDNLYMLNKKNRVYSNLKIAAVGERDYKKLKELKIHNLVSMEEFVKNKYKIIARFVTAYKIHKLINENSGVFKSVDFIKKNISNNFGNLLEDLKKYSENYKSTNNDLLEELVKFCDDTKFYDYPIYQNYIEVEKEISKIAFIDLFLHSYSRYSPPSIKDEAIPIIKELLIARKFRMDYTHYNKPVMPEEELVIEEELIEN